MFLAENDLLRALLPVDFGLFQLISDSFLLFQKVINLFIITHPLSLARLVNFYTHFLLQFFFDWRLDMRWTYVLSRLQGHQRLLAMN